MEEIHIRAVLNPESSKYIMNLKFPGEKKIEKAFSPDEFKNFVQNNEFWNDKKLIFVGDNNDKSSVFIDNVQRARIREYLELVHESGQQFLKRTMI